MREFLTFVCFIGFVIAVGYLVFGLIAPEKLSNKVSKNRPLGRKQLSKRFGLAATGLFVLMCVFAPHVATTKANQQSTQSVSSTSQVKTNAQTQKTVQKDSITTQTVKLDSSIAFKTVMQDDNGVTKGQTVVAQDGVNGVQTNTYKVTYKNGKETGRVLLTSAVTTPAKDKIVHNGTYVAPAPAPVAPPSAPSAPSCSGGYINVDGNCVQSPSSDPAGATAQCNDGTYSYSQNHSGTCSHHGGVSHWL